MIKSEYQKNRTIKTINELNKKLEQTNGVVFNSINSLIGQLEDEIKEYNELKKGNFVLPQNITFIELLKNITKVRISKGLSQQDLANLLGMSKQQINRYEEYDWQNVSVSNINQILTALDLNVSLCFADDMAA